MRLPAAPSVVVTSQATGWVNWIRRICACHSATLQAECARHQISYVTQVLLQSKKSLTRPYLLSPEGQLHIPKDFFNLVRR